MNARRMTKYMVWVLALATGLMACDKKENPATASGGETLVRIGSVSPLTGPQAHLGTADAGAGGAGNRTAARACGAQG